MIKKIHHVGLAVKSIDETAALLKELFGAELHPKVRFDTPEFSSRMVILGENCFELLEPRGSNGLIERFIKSRGEGIHHVSLLVSDREEVLRRCCELDLNVIRGAFIHPKGTFGTLIELTEGVEGLDY